MPPMDADERDWQRRVDELWESFDDHQPQAFLAAIEALARVRPPGDGAAEFERASAFDSTGHEGQAVAHYRRGLAAGLDPVRRRRATIQLASSLRNVGEIDESVALLEAERRRGSDELDDAVLGFLALALADAGREHEAVALALTALAPHLPRYQRSLANYARALGDQA